MRNLKITLQYDGTNYVGWQRQAAGVSIQGLLEEALTPIEGSPVTVHGAGRTDAGVHALAQVATIRLGADIDPPALTRALNAVLPADVRVLLIEEVDPQLLGWAADRGLNTELPNGGQAAGQFSFDAMLGDLAGHSDQTTARVTAKSIEYPTERLELAGAGWPWRPTALLALAVTAAIGVALLPAAAARRNRR